MKTTKKSTVVVINSLEDMLKCTLAIMEFDKKHGIFRKSYFPPSEKLYLKSRMKN